MTSVLVRPTTADDIPDLTQVLNQTGIFPGDMLGGMLQPTLSGESPAFWFSSLVGGTAVGSCYVVPETFAEGTWNMLSIAVRPDCQGRRVGTALLEAAEQHLRQAGHRILIVDTSGTDDFALSRRFYAKNGYDEEARIRDFWAAGDDKVTFRKAL